MNSAIKGSSTQPSTWITALPSRLSPLLLGVYLVLSQWNPCDSTSVAAGESILLILLGLVLGVFAGIQSLLDPPREARWRSYIPFAIFTFCIWTLVCSYFTLGTGNARSAFLGAWQSIAICGVFTAIYRQIHVGSAGEVYRWMIGLSLGSALGALYQYFVTMPQLRVRMQQDPTSVYQQLQVQPGSAEAMQAFNRVMSTEPIGPYALTNSLAGLLATWLVAWILVAYFFVAYSPKRADVRYGLPIALGIAILGFVLLLTKSRTAWLAAVIGITIACTGDPVLRNHLGKLLVRYRKQSILSGIALLLCVAILFWKDPLLLWEAGKSLSYRMDYWQGAWKLFCQSPWIGYGPLNFQSGYTTVKSFTASENPADPHNLWIESAMWGGIPLLSIVIAAAATLTLQPIRTKLGDQRLDKEAYLTDASEPLASRIGSWISLGAILALAGILGFAILVLDTSNLSNFVFALLFCVGCLLGRGIVPPRFWQTLSPKRAMWIGFILCLVLGLHLCFSGGWMQPGVMNSLLVGMAGALAHPSPRAAESAPQRVRIQNSLGFFFWMVMLFGFMQMTFWPETRLAEWQFNRSLEMAGKPSVEQSVSALQLHALAPELARDIAESCLMESLDIASTPSAKRKWEEAYTIARTEYLKRDPRNWGTYLQIAEWDYRMAHSMGGTDSERAQSYRISASERASQAAERNPSSVQVQIQAAVYAALGNDWPRVEEYLEKASRIDRLTPHLDRKISAVSVFFPNELIEPDHPLSASERLPNQDRYVYGEPAIQRLRKLSQQGK
ncbi:MAG: O-antigen ligase family protein [Planctomycetes bacterium]|nr:O-antigen ligase family protein [Planctomycetota bacterium]